MSANAIDTATCSDTHAHAHAHTHDKVYGKGLAADCRKHVQKLNLMRADIEQNEIAQLQNNHPPEDYASTFTTEDTRPLSEDLELVC